MFTNEFRVWVLILTIYTLFFQCLLVDNQRKRNCAFLDNFSCGKCNRVFTSVLYLARHIKRVCPDMSQRKWKCDRCSKAFRHPFGLQQHIYTHTGERPHKCQQCSKAFYSANDLRRHERTHSGLLLFIATSDYCDFILGYKKEKLWLWELPIGELYFDFWW